MEDERRLTLTDGSFSFSFSLHNGLELFDDGIPGVGVLLSVCRISFDESLVDFVQGGSRISASIDAIQGRMEVSDTLLVLVLTNVHESTTIVDFAVVGLDLEGAAEVVEGFGPSLLLRPQNA